MLKGEESVDIHIKLSSSSGNTDNEIIITPKNPLDYNTKYKITLGSAIKDPAGNNFEGYSFTFTTMKRPEGHHRRSSGTDNSNKTQEASPPLSNTVPPAVQPAPQVTEPVSAKTFEDIKAHWAKKEIEMLSGMGIIKGTAQNRFEPDRKITRAEFATLLVNLLDNAQSAEIPFKDVPAGAWYYDSVAKAYSAGLIKGVTQDTFNPMAPVTRQEMVTMIVRLMDKLITRFILLLHFFANNTIQSIRNYLTFHFFVKYLYII